MESQALLAKVVNTLINHMILKTIAPMIESTQASFDATRFSDDLIIAAIPVNRAGSL
jgi:hypothetical protein